MAPLFGLSIFSYWLWSCLWPCCAQSHLFGVEYDGGEAQLGRDGLACGALGAHSVFYERCVRFDFIFQINCVGNLPIQLHELLVFGAEAGLLSLFYAG